MDQDGQVSTVSRAHNCTQGRQGGLRQVLPFEALEKCLHAARSISLHPSYYSGGRMYGSIDSLGTCILSRLHHKVAVIFIACCGWLPVHWIAIHHGCPTAKVGVGLEGLAQPASNPLRCRVEIN